MSMAAIFAALLLAAQPGSGAPWRVAGGEVEQTSQEQKSAQDSAVPSAANGAEQKPSENPPDSASPDKKAEPPRPEKPAAGEPKTAMHKRESRSRKPTQTTTADGEPRKVVIHQGGATEPVTQIMPGITPEDAIRQREGAEQLLAASGGLLEELAGRSLKPKQQGMVVQIRQYIDLANSALKESDTQRAHTLALKAYLLADDLVKH